MIIYTYRLLLYWEFCLSWFLAIGINLSNNSNEMKKLLMLENIIGNDIFFIIFFNKNIKELKKLFENLLFTIIQWIIFVCD